MPTKKPTTDPVKHRTNDAKREGGVRVGSSAGLTLPIGDTTAHFRFEFWHERIAKNDSLSELKKTERLIHEFNLEVLESRTEEYQRAIKRIMNDEDDDEEDEGPRNVKARAKRRVRSRR